MSSADYIGSLVQSAERLWNGLHPGIVNFIFMDLVWYIWLKGVSKFGERDHTWCSESSIFRHQCADWGPATMCSFESGTLETKSCREGEVSRATKVLLTSWSNTRYISPIVTWSSSLTILCFRSFCPCLHLPQRQQSIWHSISQISDTRGICWHGRLSINDR